MILIKHKFRVINLEKVIHIEFGCVADYYRITFYLEQEPEGIIFVFESKEERDAYYDNNIKPYTASEQ